MLQREQIEPLSSRDPRTPPVPYPLSSITLSCVLSLIGLALVLCAAVPLLSAQLAPGVIVVETGLESFDLIDIANAGDARIFIASRAGVISILLPDGSVAEQVFLDIREKVSSGPAEQGLLGLAFHPSYAENGYFYLVYSDLEGDTNIVRYQVSSDPAVADSTSEHILLRIEQPGEQHKAGDLNFGPDGYLYITVGDGGAAQQAQEGASFLGKLLRIDVDSGFPYSVPPDNPFVDDSETLDEVWALGLRNPWRFSFDRLTGDLFIADVGSNRFEEINMQDAAETGGQNYGWPCLEGTTTLTFCIVARPSFPVHNYPLGPGCAVIGGFVYRGTEFPAMYGHYFFTDFCSGELFSLRRTENDILELQSYGQVFPAFRISTFGEDAGGEIYVGSRPGTLYKLSSDALIPHGEPVVVAAQLEATKTGDGNGSIKSDVPGIDCGADCTHQFLIGHEVTLTATPDSRSTFAGWTGDCDDSGTVAMDEARACTATFHLRSPEHFLCYNTKPRSRVSVELALQDEFETMRHRVKKSVMFCNPASQGGAAIADAEGHLQGYKIKRARSEKRAEKQTTQLVENQFGSVRVDIREADRLLVPTAKSLDLDPDPLGQMSLLDHYKCYKIRHSSGSSFVKGLHTSVGLWPELCGNWFLRYPCLKNFFHNCPITNDLRAAKA